MGGTAESISSLVGNYKGLSFARIGRAKCSEKRKGMLRTRNAKRFESAMSAEPKTIFLQEAL